MPKVEVDLEVPKTGTCAICSGPYENWGNNPDPLGPYDARVCNSCNYAFVIPARLGAFTPEQMNRLRTPKQSSPGFRRMQERLGPDAAEKLRQDTLRLQEEALKNVRR